MKKKNNNRKETLKIMSIITLLLSIIVSIVFVVFLSNILPVKYLLLTGIGFIIFYILFTLLIFKWHNKIKTIIAFNIISTIIMVVSVFFIFKIGDTVNFLNKNFGNNSNVIVYDLVVKQESSLNSASDVKNISVLYYKDLEDDSKLLEKVTDLKLINYENNVFDMLKEVVNEQKIALVSSAYYEAMSDIDEEYESRTKIIATYEIEADQSVYTSNIDVTKNSFLVFINGIDTRTGKLPARSLSDVNILMAVNPNKKEILMTAIPRDYYVQLHGTNNLKDKLTHSGTYGGISSTMSTIEDLFGLKIDHYIRLNFNSVVNLVDAIGGININSDVDYSFTCHTNKSCIINPGRNNLDGKCALAFARERKAYASGDRHRGENQEQVISNVLTKITSSKTIISKYSEILDAVDGTFESSLNSNDITSLIKMQIDTMSKWNVNTYNVNGTTGMDYTNSYPNQKLSIMYPDYTTVTTAKNKLKKVLEQ